MKTTFMALCLCLAGCGHSTETIEANVQKTIQTKYDSDPTTQGAIIDNVELKKARDNKYNGFIHIIEADGSRIKLGLEVAVDGDVFKWTVKPPRELSAKANSKSEPKSKTETKNTDLLKETPRKDKLAA